MNSNITVECTIKNTQSLELTENDKLDLIAYLNREYEMFEHTGRPEVERAQNNPSYAVDVLVEMADEWIMDWWCRNSETVMNHDSESEIVNFEFTGMSTHKIVMALLLQSFLDQGYFFDSNKES